MSRPASPLHFAPTVLAPPETRLLRLDGVIRAVERSVKNTFGMNGVGFSEPHVLLCFRGMRDERLLYHSLRTLKNSSPPRLVAAISIAALPRHPFGFPMTASAPSQILAAALKNQTAVNQVRREL